MKYTDGNNCFVYIDHDEGTINQVSLELLTEAKHLMKRLKAPEKVVAIWLGTFTDDILKMLGDYGADHIITCEREDLNHYDVMKHTTVISEMIDAYHPQSMLIGGTVKGRELAPRISARVHTGLTADATQIDLDGETHNLAITRPAFGGNLYATIITPDHVPQMATIRPGVFEAKTFEHTSLPTQETFQYDKALHSPIEVMDIEEKDTKRTNIADAKLIVSAGRGVKNCLDLVSDVAEHLNGEVASSRALVDGGIMSKNNQVGQTGHTVRPSLYIACGISGAVQHTAGMDKSDTIIAINTDENAPIFDVADLGIVGDAQAILKQLQKQLEA